MILASQSSQARFFIRASIITNFRFKNPAACYLGKVGRVGDNISLLLIVMPIKLTFIKWLYCARH